MSDITREELRAELKALAAKISLDIGEHITSAIDTAIERHENTCPIGKKLLTAKGVIIGMGLSGLSGGALGAAIANLI